MKKYKISKKIQVNDCNTSTVTCLTKYGYGTGHKMNDMCASMWFAYLFLYYMNVVELGPISAGIILLAGQIADGIATVVVGILIDMDTPFRICNIYGKRKVDQRLNRLIGVINNILCCFLRRINISI